MTTVSSTAQQSQAFSQAARSSAEQESADAADPSMQLAAVVHSLVQVSSKALMKCSDGMPTIVRRVSSWLLQLVIAVIHA